MGGTSGISNVFMCLQDQHFNNFQFLGVMLCSATFVFLGYLRTATTPTTHLRHHAFKCPTFPSKHPNHCGRLKPINNMSNVDKRLVCSGKERPRFDKDLDKPIMMQDEKADKSIGVNFNDRDCSTINTTMNAKDEATIDIGGIEKQMCKKRECSKVASHHFYKEQMHQIFWDSSDPFMGDTSDTESTETEEEEEVIVKRKGRPRKQVVVKKTHSHNQLLQ